MEALLRGVPPHMRFQAETIRHFNTCGASCCQLVKEREVRLEGMDKDQLTQPVGAAGNPV